MARLSQGQLNYWRKRAGRPLTINQVAQQRAGAVKPAVAPAVQPATGPSPADKTWTQPNASGQTGQQQLYAAFKAKHPDAQLPTPAGGVPVDPTAGNPSDWQDSGYFSQVAQQRFDATNQENTLDRQDADATTTYQEALRRMREQTPREVESATNAGNKAGLLYSGTLGRNLGDIQTQAIRREADLSSGYQSDHQARLEARRALEEGLPLGEATARAAAVDRASGRDQSAADSRSLVPESQIPPDGQDAGVDVGTPSPVQGGRQNTNSTPKYLPRGYSNWDLAKRRAYWVRQRKARR